MGLDKSTYVGIFILSVGAPLQAAPGDTIAGARQGVIEEIIVTARKREESIQDVPVAIQALTAEQIDQYNARNLTDIADMSAQVMVYPAGSGSGANIAIRGLGAASADPGIDASVGINMDGVQTDRGHIVRQAFFDLQSVEILKGPQALFFGKNSPAGVIATTSALPGPEFEALVRFGYEFDASETYGEVVLSGPITDTLGIRAAYRGTDRDGFIDNTSRAIENSAGEIYSAEPFDLPGGTGGDLGQEEGHALRLTLDWNPSESFNAVLRVLGTTLESNSFNTVEVSRCSTPLPVNRGLVDPTGDCSVNQKQSQGAIPPQIASNWSASIGNGEPYGEFDSTLTSLKLAWDMDGFEIQSITGLYDYDYERFDNFDGTTYNQVLAVGFEEQTTFSQELRLFTKFPSKVNYMVGFFFEDFVRNIDNHGKIFAHGTDPVSGFSNTYTTASEINSTNYSVFGQVIWDITDQVEFTAGARYIDDQKDGTIANTYIHQAVADGPFTPFFALAPEGEILPLDLDDQAVAPEVTLTWRPTDSATFYAAYRTGYKSGGFGLNAVRAGTAPEERVFFEEEASGYEVGAKLDLFNGRGRLNTTLYTYEFEDLQVTAWNADTLSFTTLNAATATTEGIEVEGEFLLADGLLLRGQVGYNHGEFDDFPGSGCWSGQTVAEGCIDGRQDLSGDDLNRAPDWQGSIGFSYDVVLGNGLGLEIATEAAYTDDYQANANNNPLSIQSSYWLVNGRLGIYSADDNWDVALIGRNLTDELIVSGESDRAGSPPGNGDLLATVVRGRQVSLQFTYRM